VQQEVHRAEACDAVHQFDAKKRAVSEPLLQFAVERVVLDQVIMRGQEESAGAAGRITNRLTGLRSHDIDDGGNESARREILACATFHIGGVLFQKPLIGVALHIGREARPLFLVDQLDDQPPQLGRVLDFVLRFTENDTKHPSPFAERFENVPVVQL